MSTRSAGDFLRPIAKLPCAIVFGLALLLAATPNVRAAGVDPLKLADLGQRALRYYDELDFVRAKTTLDQALASANSAGLDQSAIAARLHLYLGLVLAAGLQLPAPATEQFKLAIKIDPTITPPDGRFNPEVTELFVAARGVAQPQPPPPAPPGATARDTSSDQAPAGGAAQTAGSGETAGDTSKDETTPGENADGNVPDDRDRTAPAAVETEKREATPPPRSPPPRVADKGHNDDDGDEEVSGDGATSKRLHPFFGALGIGAGGGTAGGHIDMKGVTPSTAPGGFAMSGLGHVTLTAGYFWTPTWLFAVEARLQLVSGPTSHCTGNVCSDPSGFAAAVMGKASYFTGDGPFKLFGTAGLGAGNIRQVVKLDGLPDCGQTRNQQCFDTVTGGPVLVAVGGGAAYELGPVLLLGGLTANMAFPDAMLNVDLTIGAGVRF
jgi:hypothetical protein